MHPLNQAKTVSPFNRYVMIKILFSVFLFSTSLFLSAQDFISSGTITYERKVNLWGNLSDNFFEDFKNSIPEWETTEFKLTFSPEKTLYTPIGSIKKRTTTPPAYDNIVYNDLIKGEYISYKNVLEKEYLIQGALRTAVWKIKDDFREIAGFSCRRATTILFDSVFVVAFYTDKIIPSAGPESFNGLPGTILGLIINRIHTSWYATEVEVSHQPEQLKITPPSKGRIISVNEFNALLPGLTQGQRSAAQRMIWFSEI